MDRDVEVMNYWLYSGEQPMAEWRVALRGRAWWHQARQWL